MTFKMIAKAPSMITSMVVLDGRLFISTEHHGRFEVVDGALIPIMPPPTSKRIH